MKTDTTEYVIIGAGLTGLSLAYYLIKAGKKVKVIEQNERAGGVINSISEKGFTYETGPTTGVIGSLEIAELFEDLHEKCELQTANLKAKKRYIWKKSGWKALPSGLISAVTTPLFTLGDKFRILGEPFRKAGGYPNESVAELVNRRLGKSFLNYAVDPFISGVYAGDPYKLITRFALPKLYMLEANYSGFVRGALKKRKEPKPANAHKVTREVFSVDGGLKSMTEALWAEIGAENISTSCKHVEIIPNGKNFKTRFTDNTEQKFEINSPQVISTIGGYALPALLPFVEKERMSPLKNMTYAGVVQVAVGYSRWTGIKLDAFGGLVPTVENRNILGVLFPSALFSNRAPQNGALLSVFLGGLKKPDFLKKTDTEIAEIVEEELRITMKVESKPDLIRIHRYKHAIAQYDIKTEKRLQSIEWIENNYPGLILAGSIRDGIGMADRVKQAKQIAHKLLSSNK